jgi:hypothetical protein
MQKSSRRSSITPVAIALALGFGVSACGGDAADGSSDPVGSASEEVWNGDWVNPLGKGIVYLSSPNGRCSGVLVKNRAFMTAKHCVEEYVNTPSQVNGFMHPWASAADAIWVHPEKDVAIVRLAFAFPVYAIGETRPVYTGSDASLNNRNVLLTGYGWTSGCTGMDPFSLRTANLKIEDNPSVAGEVRTRTNSRGQNGFEGDSGAPLLDTTSSFNVRTPLIGILTDTFGWSCPSDPPDSASYDTAEGWLLWAFFVLYNIPG